MFDLAINIWCIGALALGLLAGYLFAYSSRQDKPNGNELAALFGTVLGGTALNLIDKFKECPGALPLYVIGVAVGYVVYVGLLQIKWPLVEHLRAKHGFTRLPLFPRNAIDPCYARMLSPTASAPCKCSDAHSSQSAPVPGAKPCKPCEEAKLARQRERAERLPQAFRAPPATPSKESE